MDKPSSSKLPASIEEIQEENLNEETVEGQEEISSKERLQQKILEMKAELLALIKKEGKNRSSSYTPQNSPLEEQTTLPRTKAKYLTKKSKHFFPNYNSITSRNSKKHTPIVKIRPRTTTCGFMERMLKDSSKKVENIAEIEGESGRDIARQIAFWTKDEEIRYHIEGMPGYETADWDELKVDMKRRWGTASPERR
ncbi:hypothetical protein O181_047795 [Austropuccinia psidii MF-1]|uniref:Uncharacterized protein n=1 Tax=Austropuccinia psidii MF-1 TaxID=1389203 RepID=A0A9Q3DQU9_9BASI|nr:hypothetical protein [Austropuccinia psidii MF-1]